MNVEAFEKNSLSEMILKSSKISSKVNDTQAHVDK